MPGVLAQQGALSQERQNTPPTWANAYSQAELARLFAAMAGNQYSREAYDFQRQNIGVPKDQYGNPIPNGTQVPLVVPALVCLPFLTWALLLYTTARYVYARSRVRHYTTRCTYVCTADCHSAEPETRVCDSTYHDACTACRGYGYCYAGDAGASAAG